MDSRRVFYNLSRCALVLVPCFLLIHSFIFLFPHNKSFAHDRSSAGIIYDAAYPLESSRPLKFHVADEVVAFLGKRPHAKTFADIPTIIKACNSVGVDGWRDTSNCVNYLRDSEDEYLSIGKDDSFACNAENPLKYHTYWRGPFTWRVSFMLKSFLFTQNLECSKMYLWLDADWDEDTVEVAMESPVLAPFLPLVRSGLINLRAWKYPTGVYIPRHYRDNQEYNHEGMLTFRQHQIPRGAVAVSDSVRFIILHQEGGLYTDMDTMFLKDLRPLLIAPDMSFAERWGAHPGPGEYNTAYLRLQANSSLSSRAIQGAARMGLNFHPRVLGRLLAKSEHENDLVMFETGVFDPLWSFFDHDAIGFCTVPCFGDFAQFYNKRPIPGEWSTLRPEDKLPGTSPGNRTLSNFFRGAYAHHIHNQWSKHVVPGSWVWVADQTYNQFFRGQRTNLYGEDWSRAPIDFATDEAAYRP
ncbi:protein of unknown function [Taphrina deformans PYCC 5710]|uniref:SnoRNA binding protein n=1 Tax=Taphrina deformans (strain PYCC 5710 / ATCC 11124 / CBS 356.35 / IMI 108563 / JCM 9778 / NBRC 8474) TaxID=1097556 RepID=R4X8A4_TAPDE|nr:protein of unknown function [Taphrina deformans PYCC 5710]|eukprot:CCG81768.1 protein of unknown function [Taphrina deformans PYCC 5710]